MLDAGLRVGLGTDVAAGPELNLWQVMRTAIEAQKARSFYEKKVRVPTPADVLFLATQGAAEALGKGGRIGSDLTVMNIAALRPPGIGGELSLEAEDILALCIYRGGPHAVAGTFVRGRPVF